MTRLCIFACLACVATADGQEELVTDPNSPELLKLATPFVVDENRYGCGRLYEPGRTYFVSLNGRDEADGLTWDTAWRHVHHAFGKLRAGDTLIVGEGEYFEQPLVLDARKGQTGELGRPITVMAAPRHRVVITAAVRPSLRRTPGTRFMWEARMELEDDEGTLWEADTEILLQRTAGFDMVEELPGTWWYDAKGQMIYVHFSDSRADAPHPLAVRSGRASDQHFTTGGRSGQCTVDVRANYIRFKGLSFKYTNVCMVIRGNRTWDNDDPRWVYSDGHHVTVEDCEFSSTWYAGLVLTYGAQWNLIKGNYGALNGEQGSLLMNNGGESLHDNLFLGNRCDPADPVGRRAGGYHRSISNYGVVGQRNHVIGNIMKSRHCYRTKYTVSDTVIQGNVMVGSSQTFALNFPVGAPLAYQWEGPEDRIIFRNNVFHGPVATRAPVPPGGAGDNWAGPYRAFVNNFALFSAKEPFLSEAEQAARIDAARFADPAYLDYRLQSDSPLKGKALGGGDIGAYHQPAGRVFYVGNDGDDANPGTCNQQAFRTLAHATAALEPGDTLYVMPGIYEHTLTVIASGNEEARITIRAWGKQQTLLPAIRVSGSWVVLEGFTVSAPETDGILVTGDNVTLKRCVAHRCGGAGVKADGAVGLNVSHCTVAGNGTGLVLDRDSMDATVRDSILAANREAAVHIADDSVHGFLASHNCYFGANLDRTRIAREVGSVIGDPAFVDLDEGNLCLQGESLAVHLAAFGRVAGAAAALKRAPAIESIKVANVSNDSAVITWRTPQESTTGYVRYRAQGAPKWHTQAHALAKGDLFPSLGRGVGETYHGVALTGLEPSTTYEFTVHAQGLRCGTAQSTVQSFTTSDEGSEPTTYYVATSGDDTADGTSLKTAWRSIHKACFAAGPGDTVLIQPGVYRDRFTPLSGGTREHRLTFRADGGEVLIDGGSVLVPFVILIDKSHITFDGFTFANAPKSSGASPCFNIMGCRGIEFLNCRVGKERAESQLAQGFFVHESPEFRLEGNVVWGTRYPLKCYESPNTLIRNNTFAVAPMMSLNIRNNVLARGLSSSPFVVRGPSEGTRVVNNIFYGSGSAFTVSSQESTLFASDYNLFMTRQSIGVLGIGNKTVSSKTLEEWRENSGHGLHSLQTDAMFVNPDDGDFRLRPGSPAIGAGEGGANIGACGVTALLIHGNTALRLGEGRTLRLEARPTAATSKGTTFVWHLPNGRTHNGQTLEYTPPPELSRFTVKLTGTDETGKASTIEAPASVPPAALEQLAGRGNLVEAEDYVAQGGGEVGIGEPKPFGNGTCITHWFRSKHHWLEWEFTVPKDGRYTILARYAAPQESTRCLTLDGASPGPEYNTARFPATGGFGADDHQDTWAVKGLGPPLDLKAGKHRFRMTYQRNTMHVDFFIVADSDRHGIGKVNGHSETGYRK